MPKSGGGRGKTGGVPRWEAKTAFRISPEEGVKEAQEAGEDAGLTVR